MTPMELTSACEANGIDWAADAHEGEPGWFLHWNNPNDPGDDEVSHVTAKALPDLKWDALLTTVIGGRDVVHVTRIVGYYSRTNNWNRSKLGELKGR